MYQRLFFPISGVFWAKEWVPHEDCSWTSEDSINRNFATLFGNFQPGHTHSRTYIQTLAELIQYSLFFYSFVRLFICCVYFCLAKLCAIAQTYTHTHFTHSQNPIIIVYMFREDDAVKLWKKATKSTKQEKAEFNCENCVHAIPFSKVLQRDIRFIKNSATINTPKEFFSLFFCFNAK